MDNDQIENDYTLKILKEELFKKANDIAKLKQKIICTDVLITESSNKQHENDLLNQRLNHSHQLIENYKNEIDKLSYQLKSNLNEITPLRKEIEIINKKNKSFQTELVALNREIDSYKGLARQTDAAILEKDEKIAAMVTELKELKIVNKKLESSTNKLKLQRELSLNQIQQLVLENTSLKKLDIASKSTKKRNRAKQNNKDKDNKYVFSIDCCLKELRPAFPILSPISTENESSSSESKSVNRKRIERKTSTKKKCSIGNTGNKGSICNKGSSFNKTSAISASADVSLLSPNILTPPKKDPNLCSSKMTTETSVASEAHNNLATNLSNTNMNAINASANASLISPVRLTSPKRHPRLCSSKMTAKKEESISNVVPNNLSNNLSNMDANMNVNSDVIYNSADELLGTLSDTSSEENEFSFTDTFDCLNDCNQLGDEVSESANEWAISRDGLNTGSRCGITNTGECNQVEVNELDAPSIDSCIGIRNTEECNQFTDASEFNRNGSSIGNQKVNVNTGECNHVADTSICDDSIMSMNNTAVSMVTKPNENAADQTSNQSILPDSNMSSKKSPIGNRDDKLMVTEIMDSKRSPCLSTVIVPEDFNLKNGKIANLSISKAQNKDINLPADAVNTIDNCVAANKIKNAQKKDKIKPVKTWTSPRRINSTKSAAAPNNAGTVTDLKMASQTVDTLCRSIIEEHLCVVLKKESTSRHIKDSFNSLKEQHCASSDSIVPNDDALNGLNKTLYCSADRLLTVPICVSASIISSGTNRVDDSPNIGRNSVDSVPNFSTDSVIVSSSFGTNSVINSETCGTNAVMSSFCGTNSKVISLNFGTNNVVASPIIASNMNIKKQKVSLKQDKTDSIKVLNSNINKSLSGALASINRDNGCLKNKQDINNKKSTKRKLNSCKKDYSCSSYEEIVEYCKMARPISPCRFNIIKSAATSHLKENNLLLNGATLTGLSGDLDAVVVKKKKKRSESKDVLLATKDRALKEAEAATDLKYKSASAIIPKATTDFKMKRRKIVDSKDNIKESIVITSNDIKNEFSVETASFMHTNNKSLTNNSDTSLPKKSCIKEQTITAGTPFQSSRDQIGFVDAKSIVEAIRTKITKSLIFETTKIEKLAKTICTKFLISDQNLTDFNSIATAFVKVYISLDIDMLNFWFEICSKTEQSLTSNKIIENIGSACSELAVSLPPATQVIKLGQIFTLCSTYYKENDLLNAFVSRCHFILMMKHDLKITTSNIISLSCGLINSLINANEVSRLKITLIDLIKNSFKNVPQFLISICAIRPEPFIFDKNSFQPLLLTISHICFSRFLKEKIKFRKHMKIVETVLKWPPLSANQNEDVLLKLVTNVQNQLAIITDDYTAQSLAYETRLSIKLIYTLAPPTWPRNHSACEVFWPLMAAWSTQNETAAATYNARDLNKEEAFNLNTNVGFPDARNSRGFPDANNSTGIPDAKNSPGFPDAKNSPGFPDAKNNTGFPDDTNRLTECKNKAEFSESIDSKNIAGNNNSMGSYNDKGNTEVPDPQGKMQEVCLGSESRTNIETDLENQDSKKGRFCARFVEFVVECIADAILFVAMETTENKENGCQEIIDSFSVLFLEDSVDLIIRLAAFRSIIFLAKKLGQPLNQSLSAPIIRAINNYQSDDSQLDGKTKIALSCL